MRLFLESKTGSEIQTGVVSPAECDLAKSWRPPTPFDDVNVYIISIARVARSFFSNAVCACEGISVKDVTCLQIPVLGKLRKVGTTSVRFRRPLGKPGPPHRNSRVEPVREANRRQRFGFCLEFLRTGLPERSLDWSCMCERAGMFKNSLLDDAFVEE